MRQFPTDRNGDQQHDQKRSEECKLTISISVNPRRRSSGTALGMMPAFCRGEASAQFGVRPNRITTNMAFRSGKGYVVQGNYPDGNGRTSFFNCWFDRDGNFASVN